METTHFGGTLTVNAGSNDLHEASADVDFRIESVLLQAGKFVVDAGADRLICMGTSTVQTIHGSVASVQIDLGGTSAAHI